MEANEFKNRFSFQDRFSLNIPGKFQMILYCHLQIYRNCRLCFTSNYLLSEYNCLIFSGRK